MKKLDLPEGYQPVTPYLILDNAGEFFGFVVAVFGAEYVYEPTLDGIKVIHANIVINSGQIMFCDSKPDYPPQPAGLFVYVKDCDATYDKAIALGAATVNQPDEQPYGRSAGIKDMFGNTWWITSLASSAT
jgi:PhnB protein